MGVRAVLLLAAVLLYGDDRVPYFERPGNPDLSASDALWYRLVTLTTVGYGDYFPKTPGGRYLVGVPLLVLGWACWASCSAWWPPRPSAPATREAKGMNPARTWRQHVVRSSTTPATTRC